MKEWDIPIAKIGVIMTDNGSNMLKAFRQSLDFSEGSEDEEEDTTDFESSSRILTARRLTMMSHSSFCQAYKLFCTYNTAYRTEIQ